MTMMMILYQKVALELGAQVIQTQRWHLQGEAGWSFSSVLGEVLALPDAMSAAGPPTAHNGGGGGGVPLLFSLSKQKTLQEKISELCPGLVKKRICNRETTFEMHSLLSSQWRLFILRLETGVTRNTPAFDVRTPAGHMSLQGSFLLSFWLAQ